MTPEKRQQEAEEKARENLTEQLFRPPQWKGPDIHTLLCLYADDITHAHKDRYQDFAKACAEGDWHEVGYLVQAALENCAEEWIDNHELELEQEIARCLEDDNSDYEYECNRQREIDAA